MDSLFALIIGMIQGISEFLPISSSGHLKLFNYFFMNSLKENLLFELICNLGTATATIIFLRKKLIKLFSKNIVKNLLPFILALVPLAFIYFFFRAYVFKLNNYKLIGFFFIISGIILSIAIQFNFRKTNGKYLDYLFIGLFQSFALISGISRSGSTISAGIYRGFDIKRAILFSFLLAIFTVLGGNILEFYKASREITTYNLPIHTYLIGFFSSLATGLLTIRWIFGISHKKQLKPFMWYLFILGLFTAIYFNCF